MTVKGASWLCVWHARCWLHIVGQKVNETGGSAVEVEAVSPDTIPLR